MKCKYVNCKDLGFCKSFHSVPFPFPQIESECKKGKKNCKFKTFFKTVEQKKIKS